jgi:hypothetical protein
MVYTSLVSANCLNKGLFLLGDKNKQAQALPLKEDFRQVPGQVTGQVFQTTWRKEILPQLVKQPSNSTSKLQMNYSN